MYLNLIQIAESFGVSEKVVEDWIRTEALPHTPDRGKIRDFHQRQEVQERQVGNVGQREAVANQVVMPLQGICHHCQMRFDFLLRRSTAFRKIFYTGSNEKAAAYSGIRTKRVIFFTTVLCSTLASFAGIIYMTRFGSA